MLLGFTLFDSTRYFVINRLLSGFNLDRFSILNFFEILLVTIFVVTNLLFFVQPLFKIRLFILNPQKAGTYSYTTLIVLFFSTHFTSSRESDSSIQSKSLYSIIGKLSLASLQIPKQLNSSYQTILNHAI
jgi:hypothetical protein